jgi:hypothetical protein
MKREAQKRIERMIKIKSVVKMSKSWDMLEICAARTTAAGVAEVLVLWRPTWEPEDEVSSGAVWDAWMSECAREKSKEKAAVASKIAATDGADNDDNNDEFGSGSESEIVDDDDDKPLMKKAKDTPGVAVADGRGRRVKIVKKVVSLVTVGTEIDTAKVNETVTPKRGRGRPPKIATGGALKKQKK